MTRMSTSVAHAVLFSTDLFRSVAQFQTGAPAALRKPLAHLRKLLGRMRYRCGYGPSLWLGLPNDEASWLNVYGLRALMLLARHCPSAVLNEDVFDYMSGCGHMDAVCLLHDLKAPCTKYALNAAAEHGHLDVVNFLHSERKEGCTTHAMDYAAKNGHVDVVRFLHEHRTEGCTIYAMAAAASHGHLATVMYLHANRSEGCTAAAMDLAACNGDEAMVRFLHTYRPEGCSYVALDGAAKIGHLGTVRFLDTHRSEGRVADALLSAARFGHTDVVDYLLTRTAYVDAVLNVAARNNHASLVTHLVSTYATHGSPKAFIWAAMAGHTDVLEALWDFDMDACPLLAARRAASEFKHERTLQWLDTCYTSSLVPWTGVIDHIEFVLAEARPRLVF
ncbi:hypothetical protein SDRG_09753 [Saprolegnia diclina VS20]|uniref:Uncharacterized protein n=1 Tax=Saprolegnia diclina (strain VS20) TaxID=1156394 RepID=T0RRL9_SAPDV|nr:hypothetical protein SDRG_09753 [Saprolegnia diclina VS20]EQC32782.1 hypothetical protein SDRG_09753 [Saprolegnia diclina VS20]|eukprot:XP_008613926.1 hypothetical protein SDRG_09753 [Saprolegnia diclina VS20]